MVAGRQAEHQRLARPYEGEGCGWVEGRHTDEDNNRAAGDAGENSLLSCLWGWGGKGGG